MALTETLKVGDRVRYTEPAGYPNACPPGTEGTIVEETGADNYPYIVRNDDYSTWPVASNEVEKVPGFGVSNYGRADERNAESEQSDEDNQFAQEAELADWERALLEYDYPENTYPENSDVTVEAVEESKYRDDCVREAYLLVNDGHHRNAFVEAIAEDQGQWDLYEAFGKLRKRFDSVASLLEEAHPELKLEEDPALAGPLRPYVVAYALTGDVAFAYAASSSGL